MIPAAPVLGIGRRLFGYDAVGILMSKLEIALRVTDFVEYFHGFAEYHLFNPQSLS